ncbi:UMP-CMP kinase 2, mitochondrial [Callorhinchus milii]|nr:UMP-CMP kinase 2, mitochondrial [Callorhinchus milii]
MRLSSGCTAELTRSLGISLRKEWSKRIFAVEVDRGSDPLYFTLSPTSRTPWDEASALHQLLARGQTYSLFISAENRIQAAKAHSRLRDRLTSLPERCRVMDLMSFCPDQPGSLRRGFLIQDSRSGGDTGTLLTALASEARPADLCSYTCSGEAGGRAWPGGPGGQGGPGQGPGQGGPGQGGPGQDEEVLTHCISVAEKPEFHPSLLNLKNSVVFYTYGDAYSVLQECKDLIPEANEVLQEADHCSRTSRKGKFPVIGIEGLDATGKSTLTESLRESFKAVLLKSPPDCIGRYRKRFDTEPPLIRRAFYALGNYITASFIANKSATSPVIVDRYWHSTAAYAIATEVSGKAENLPPPHHELYQWPLDLLQPDLVLLLTLSPEERIRRIEGRGEQKTKEEMELEANCLFRQRVEETYKRMENPACVLVDASASKEEVFKNAHLLIKRYCNTLS